MYKTKSNKSLLRLSIATIGNLKKTYPPNNSRRIVICFLLLCIVSTSFYASDLEKNLKLAGKNRIELEKVLKHYQKKTKDFQKFEAAKFLIENMDAHSFCKSNSLDKYYQNLDSILILNKLNEGISRKQESLLKELKTPDFSDVEMEEDLKYISADFLINNIDRSFESWNTPWAKHLNFEDFCEYILPYRVYDERPNNWRSLYKDSITLELGKLLDYYSLDSGLIAFYPFEKKGKDCSGNKWNAKLNGKITYSTRDSSKAVNLNGSDCFISIPPKAFSLKKDFTISFWMKQREKKEYSPIFEIGKDSSAFISFSSFSKDGDFAQFSIKEPSKPIQKISTTALPVGTWTHVAISLKGKTLQLFINGIETSNKDIEGILLDTKTLKKFYIGKSLNTERPLYNGEFDDFRVYDRALLGYEIRTLYGKDKNIKLQEIAWAIDGLYHHKLYQTPLFYGGFNSTLLIHLKMGTCYDYSILNTFIFRALGIPVAMDNVFQWANRSGGHSWNALIAINGKTLDSADHNPLGEHIKTRIDHKNFVSKIYRHTFAKQKNSLFLIKGKDFIPDEFDTPCLKDVTELYLKCANPDLKLTIQPTKKQRFAYLCTFDNRNWTPIAWTKTDNQSALFSNMGKGIVYLPAYYTQNGISPAAQPFILNDSGEVKTLIPEYSQLQKIKLSRKYIEGENLKIFARKMQNAKFQVANKKDFSDSKTIYQIDSIPESNYNVVDLTLDKPYRFFRYVAGTGSFGGDIAELEVFGVDSTQKLNGTVIGNNDIPEFSILNAFDGNALSYYQSSRSNAAWIGLDFGVPVVIKSFWYLPRNDDNFIRKGEEYELFFWDKQWITLGKQIGGKKQYLEYDKVPNYALFWLRNITKGQEERIFTYENGKQVWW